MRKEYLKKTGRYFQTATEIRESLQFGKWTKIIDISVLNLYSWSILTCLLSVLVSFRAKSDLIWLWSPLQERDITLEQQTKSKGHKGEDHADESFSGACFSWRILHILAKRVEWVTWWRFFKSAILLHLPFKTDFCFHEIPEEKIIILSTW